MVQHVAHVQRELHSWHTPVLLGGALEGECFPFVRHCSHRIVAPVIASSGNRIGHVWLGLGSLCLMPHGFVERTSGPCSHLSATEKAGAWRNQPARVGSSSQKEDKHTTLPFIIMPLVLHCNGLCIYVQLPEHPGRLLKPGSSWRY